MRTCAVVSGLMTVVSMFPASTATVQSSQALNPRIPVAIRAMYDDIRDGRDWLNPKITIRAEGVAVESSGLAGTRRTVPVEELRVLLASLPVTAWPYGRVIMASDTGLRQGDGSDDEAIRRNHEAAQEVLDELDVRVEWWPS